jgi:agmatinase
VVIIPVPYDSTTSYLPGARRGPLAIIEASTHMELFDEELKKETFPIGIHTMDQLEITATGPEQMVERVSSVTSYCLNANKFPVMIGGEHSLTLGMVRPIKERYKHLSVLQLDAHADLREEYQGTPYSHASIGKRIKELCPLVQVGVRSMSREEWNFLPASGVKTFFAQEVREKRGWIDEVLKSLSDEVYITLDLDVFDPSIIPSVGTPEPGGLGWYEVLDLLRMVISRKRIVGMDIVELTPLPGNTAPDFLAAKLIYRMIGYWTERMSAECGALSDK